jgi:hypothetical protein
MAMKGKKKDAKEMLDIQELLKGVIQEVYTELYTPEDGGLVDIITFCEKFLNIDLNKSPYFKLILKMYYSNSTGNENLQITEEDIKTIESIDNYGKGNPWLLDKANKIMNGEITKPFQYLVLVLGRRSGKANPLNSKILTPNGWTTMGEIRVGDHVISQDGTATVVTGVYPQGEKDIYKITMSDDSSTECCAEHLWLTKTKRDKKHHGSVKTTEQIMRSLEQNHKIPMVCPVQFENRNNFCDSYHTGKLLANCDANGFNTDDEISFLKKELFDFNKYVFIPYSYKINSIDERLAILQGILDFGGVIGNHGKILFEAKSVLFANDIQLLVRSFGGVATINKESDKKYCISIRLPKQINPFRDENKANVYSECVFQKSEIERTIKSIEYVGKKQAQCISVAHPSKLYVTDDFIVTHNTFCSSVIISYEIYKLLSMIVCPSCKERRLVKSGEPCPECGDRCYNYPQAYYGINGNEPLRMFLAAVAQKQAIDPGLEFVKQRVKNSKFFDNKFNPEVESLFFQTEYDKELNEKWKKAGLMPQEKGSVFVKALAANTSASHGTGTICLLLDEFALFNTAVDAKESDRKILEAMLPQTQAYRHRGEGRVIMISMPEGEEGAFYEYYEQAKKDDDILMMQMPTWEFRGSEQNYSRESCESVWKGSGEDSEGSFDKLYGAQFSNQGEAFYFDQQAIEMAFNGHGIRNRFDKMENPHYRHYMHIDCAFNSDNYAYCIVHIEQRFNSITQTIDTFYIEDDSYFWTPSKAKQMEFVGEDGITVDIYSILRTIAKKAKAFKVEMVSFDNMQSLESKTFLSRLGLNLRQTPFTGQKKAEFYNSFRHSLNGGRVILCNDDYQLKEEMKSLRVYYNKRGAQIEISKIGGRKKSDDKIDCLVGACYMTTQKSTRRYPNITVCRNVNPFGKGNNTTIGGNNIFGNRNYFNSYNGGS